MHFERAIIIAAVLASGCTSSRQNSAVIYPPAELVQITPAGDGQGINAGISAPPGWFADTVNPVPAEHNGMTVLYAVPRVVGATAAAAWRNKLATLGVVAGALVVKKGMDGALDDLAFWEDKEEEDPKGFKKRSPILERPDEIAPGSHQQLLATRDSCQFIGSSSQQPTLDATFGSSGSSACHIDTKPESEHVE